MSDSLHDPVVGCQPLNLPGRLHDAIRADSTVEHLTDADSPQRHQLRPGQHHLPIRLDLQRAREFADRQRALSKQLRTTWLATLSKATLPVTIRLGSHEAQDLHARLFMLFSLDAWKLHIFNRADAPSKVVYQVEEELLALLMRRRQRLTSRSQKIDELAVAEGLEQAHYPKKIEICEQVLTKTAREFLLLIEAYDALILRRATLAFNDVSDRRFFAQGSGVVRAAMDDLSQARRTLKQRSQGMSDKPVAVREATMSVKSYG